ncbi:MAG: TIGR00153 family protein [Sedimentisphaerales bacterium]|nr:TIGR00153 family protein [Sedimentisphaerales bacterium]
MGVLGRLFSQSPFVMLGEHSKKVHECVELIRPLVDALLAEDYDKLDELHNLMSKTEHEADVIKNELRGRISRVHFLSVGRSELNRFVGYQDDVADAAQDFAVVLLLRRTRMPQQLKSDFRAFAEQVIVVSQHMMALAEKLSALAEGSFGPEDLQDMLVTVERISAEEWQTDRLERKFARKSYAMEDKLDFVTIMFLDKYCKTLSRIANAAEKASKYLRLIVRQK